MQIAQLREGTRAFRKTAALGGASLKFIKSLAAAILLTLLICGCSQPTDPAYSPDGASLVFQKGGKLYLRKAAADRLIGEHVEGNVSWSPNSRLLAFTDGGTTILDVSTGRRVHNSAFTGPYSWQDGLLTAVGKSQGVGCTLVTLDPQSATEQLQVDLPFTPRGMASARDGMLIWDGKADYWFDGPRVGSLPELAGMNLIGQRPESPQSLLVKIVAREHRQVAEIYEWNGPGSKLSRAGTIDFLARSPEHPEFFAVVDMKAADDWGLMAALLMVVQPANERDRRQLVAFIDKYRLLDPAERTSKNPSPKGTDSRLQGIISRSKVTFTCLTGNRRDTWGEVVSVVTKPRGDFPAHMGMGINKDGTAIAVSYGNVLKTYTLRNPIR